MLVTFRREFAPALRVFALPYAGASPAWLRPWALSLPQGVELSTIALGPRPRTIEQLVSRALELLPRDRPFVLYGHSLGAAWAYELARVMGPRALVVSGRAGPTVPLRLTPISGLPDSSLVRELSDRYGALPSVVLESPALLASVLPGLRADLAAAETYRHLQGPRLSIPVHALGGADDPLVSREDLDAWRAVTDGEVTISMKPGGHFFIQDEAVRAELCAQFSTYR